MMRDEPMGVLPPERFKPSSYSKKRGEKAVAELARLKGLDQAGINAEAHKYLDRRQDMRTEGIEKGTNENEKLRAMLEKTRAWEPPTAGHHGLKDFMVSQLEASMTPARDYAYYSDEADQDATMTPESVVAKLIDRAERNIESAKNEHREEVERTEGRNRWLADLRASLA
jgi:hypothetical protein